ncbi:MAG TPA: ATPase, partial [Asanoa sp.]|nr:ATPase [Asanoa sp.]
MTSEATAPTPIRAHPLAVAARIVMLALVAVLVLLTTQQLAQLWWIGLLIVAGVPAVVVPRHPVLAPLGRFAEVIIVGFGAAQVAAHTANTSIGQGVGAAALLPYLSVPLTVTALRRLSRESAALLSVAALALVAGGAISYSDGNPLIAEPVYLVVAAQWLILASLGTLAASTLQRIMQQREKAGRPQPYAEATRLLTQLRSVARQLPGATLDPGGISEHL